MDYLLIAFIWTAYCALHSFLISIWFTNLMKRSLKEYYAFYRLSYNALALILFVPLYLFTIQTKSEVIITYSFPLIIIRYVVISISILILLKAFFFDYDYLTFFGIRQMFDFGKKISRNYSGGIRKNGLLGLIRHPLYFGVLLFIWCQTFRFTDIIVNMVLTIYIFIGTRLEEKKLIMEFGEPYIKYQHQVPMLIPFTKAKG